MPPPPNYPSSRDEIAISVDLGRSRARCRTWTRGGLRELMSIITPTRLWRGVGRAGSAATTCSPFISGRDRDLGDLGRSGARCRTWTRCGLRELMSIITPTRLWRGVGRAGSAATTYSPFISGRDRDLGDLGRSGARCRTWSWTRCGLRELMSIITPSRFWRRAGRGEGEYRKETHELTAPTKKL